MVYLTGDTHGDLDRFRHGRLRWLGKRDIVVVLGDFGFVWDGSAEEQKKLDWLRKRPYTLLFLDGSHEMSTMCAAAACWSWRAKSTCASVGPKARTGRNGSRA